MRKKYLSALLFGALLFASAGTFTSCKDYDDDISNLQSQITANADAIETLQGLVDQGDYVTNVEKSAEGLVITFKEAGPKTITLEDQVGSVVEVKGGVLYIDGEPTDIKVAEPTPTPEPGEEAKDQIIIENNMWSVLQEDGTYKSTGIPVTGVSVSGSEADGYTFTIYTNGSEEPQVVKLQSASSSLVDIIVVDAKYERGEKTIPNGTVSLAEYTFKLTSGKKADDWKGSKKLPATGSVIVAQTVPVMVQINPVDVDGKDVSFSLVNSQNKTADIEFEVKDYTGLFTGTRTANANGLYDLTVADQIFSSQNAANDYTKALRKDKQLYAVVAGKVRSEYKVSYQEGETSNLAKYYLMDGNTEKGEGTIDDGNSATTTDGTMTVSQFELNKWYTVAVDDESALYDMYLSAADEDEKVLFGIDFQEVDGKFQVRATKTPDNVTKPQFDINVETVDKNGNWRTSTITVNLSELISDAYVYDLTKYQLKDETEAKKNSFSVNVADMTSDFNADQLALWNTKLDYIQYSIQDEDGKTITANDLSLVLVDKDGKDIMTGEGEKARADLSADAVKKAKTMSVRFNNTVALAKALDLNTTYYVVVECMTVDDNDSNKKEAISTAKIPFTLSIPSIETFFVQQAGVFVDGVANAYMDAKAGTSTIAASYPFSSAFNKFGTGIANTTFDFEMDGSTVIVNNKKSNALAALYPTTTTTDSRKDKTKLTITKDNITKAYIQLTGDQNSNTGLHEGYKQELIVNVKNAKFAGVWAYGTDTDVDYTFKIKVMSPLYEGEIVPADGIVEIPASELNGHQVNGSDIVGYTYNDILYSIFPDKKGTTDAPLAYKRKEIQDVTFAPGDTNIFTVKERANAYSAGDEKTPAKDGYVVVTPKNLAQTTDSKLTVTLTDAWGYKKVAEIPVRVVVGE